MARFARGYGLVIGVSTYHDPARNIPIVERDARALYSTLTDPDTCGYPASQVALLCGAEASSSAIVQAIGRLADRAGRDDTVLLAFGGHGAPNERNLYTLATSDAEFCAGEHIREGSGLTIIQLANALKQIRSERLLLLINACFAGQTSALAGRGGLREPSSGSALPDREGDRLLADAKGRALITASRADQRSFFQREQPTSAFGQALIDGLRGVGISPQSGYIGLFDLYGRIYTQVAHHTASQGNSQEPTLSLVAGVGSFPIAPHSGATTRDETKISQARPKVGLIRDVQLSISNQVIDNRKVIDFGSAQIGSMTFKGDIAQGDIIKAYYGGAPTSDPDDAPLDPLKELPKLQQRVSVARNVDEDARDEAAAKIGLAVRALDRGDRAKARERIDEALALLDPLNNGYLTSAARKLRAVRQALG
ncbi:MAG: caspase family protein [Oscillochloris sp.]|nr:caspase family protein [Oscillochloris sp.]